MNAKINDKKRDRWTCLSVLKTRDKNYFKELFNNLSDITGISVPGECNFCQDKAWHIFEETIEDKKGRLASTESNFFLCCDNAQCLARAMPEIFQKFLQLVMSKIDMEKRYEQ